MVKSDREKELEEVCKILVAIIDEDFLPQIGKCTCQDYGRLNDGLIRARKVLSDG